MGKGDTLFGILKGMLEITSPLFVLPWIWGGSRIFDGNNRQGSENKLPLDVSPFIFDLMTKTSNKGSKKPRSRFQRTKTPGSAFFYSGYFRWMSAGPREGIKSINPIAFRISPRADFYSRNLMMIFSSLLGLFVEIFPRRKEIQPVAVASLGGRLIMRKFRFRLFTYS